MAKHCRNKSCPAGQANLLKGPSVAIITEVNVIYGSKGQRIDTGATAMSITTLVFFKLIMILRIKVFYSQSNEECTPQK